MVGNDAIIGGIETKTSDCLPTVGRGDEEGASNPDINSMSRNKIDT